MKASLKSARIAPKKANIIAKMVRGMDAQTALEQLERTNKKAARIVEKLLRSAVANATHNDSQTASDLRIKSIVVNQGTSYRRGVPMARGRMRPMRKFLSHISITLGVDAEKEAPKKEAKKPETKKASQKATSSAQSTSKSAPAKSKSAGSAASEKTKASASKNTSSDKSSS